MDQWFKRPLDHRAHAGGELGCNDVMYKGGEIMPFYIPRPVMPQIDECDEAGFLLFCSDKGISAVTETVDPRTLRAHQRVNMGIVHSMSAEVLAKPALISKDNFILDGNHRWTAHIKLKIDEMNVIRVDLEFEEAIDLMFSFPKTYDLEDVSEIRN